MRKFINWMFAAVLICCGGWGLTSCVEKEDNPVSGVDDPDVVVQEPLEIDPNEFQPTDVSVALLGSLSDYAKEEAVCYWFPNVQDKVTDETMVVITDEITADNEADILKVLNRYGMLLLVDPKDDNVHQYGGYFGVDPNVDCSKAELLGLTGLGDQFVSYVGDDEKASDDPIAPPYIAGDDISDIDPEAYLRLKAFAQWVEIVDKKYTDYHNKLAERQKAIADAIAAYDAEGEAAARRVLTRDGKEDDKDDDKKIDIATLEGVAVSANLCSTQKFKSYNNDIYGEDEDTCYLSVTCNYSLKPLYGYPQGNTPGADYYIVETSVNWDCSKTLRGNEYHKDHAVRWRRSFLFFPIECQFYTEPIPTKSNYVVQMMAGNGGDLKPDNVKQNTTINKKRAFTIDAKLSGGYNFGHQKGDAGGHTDDFGKHGANVDASLGFGATWSKEETFTVEEYYVSKLVDGQKVGHTITVPGGEDGYRPEMVNKSLDKGIEVPRSVNFRKTLHTNESWAWKISGTAPDTEDAAIKLKFVATPKVSWSSYFYTSHEWGVKESSYTMSEIKEIPAPNRRDLGALSIKNTGDEDGKQLAIFAVRAIDITDPDKPFVAYDNLNSVFVLFGNNFDFSLPANRKYDIELEMGRRSNKVQTYHLDRPWEVTSITKTGQAQELVTDMLFSIKK